jgi:hypothetical protein
VVTAGNDLTAPVDELTGKRARLYEERGRKDKDNDQKQHRERIEIETLFLLHSGCLTGHIKYLPFKKILS